MYTCIQLVTGLALNPVIGLCTAACKCIVALNGQSICWQNIRGVYPSHEPQWHAAAVALARRNARVGGEVRIVNRITIDRKVHFTHTYMHVILTSLATNDCR